MTRPGKADDARSRAIGELLRAYRKRALLSQEGLAERAGLNSRTIRDLEAGRVRRPHGQSLRLLADAMGLSDRERAALTGAELAVAVSQLPMDVAGFTGRAESLARLDGLLPEDAGQGQTTTVVISAIAGTAGVGKTALAVHWAHRVPERFQDGQLYVNLRGYAPGPPLRPLGALALLLGALGVAADRIPVELEAAAGLYRSLLAGRRVLILLDNARDAEQVRPLLPGSPGCVVVVTSRDRLAGLVASHGAQQLTLDVLAPDEAIVLLGRIIGEGRVAAEPQAAAELVRICGFLPLAVRIAAANLANLPGEPALPIAGYVARLCQGDRLTELAVEGDAQAAVRTAFDSSYAALDSDTQRMFRLLGLVPGPDFTPEAAAALAGASPGQAARVLERLASAHLIESHAAGRFSFHDLVRHYARERTEQEDSEPEHQVATGGLLGWYVHSTDVAVRLLCPEKLRLPAPEPQTQPPAVGLAEQTGALAWLNAERANLVAATTHAAEHGPRSVAWLLADMLRGYFWYTRHMVDWIAVARAGLSAAVDAGDQQAQAAAHLSLADVHCRQSQYQQAIEHCTHASTLTRQSGWLDGQATALGNLGAVHLELGQLQEAADHITQALAIDRQTGWRAGQAVKLHNLGSVHREMGRLARAADYMTQALTLYREIGHQGGQAAALDTLGEVYRDLGRLNDARDHLTQALALYRGIGDRHGETHGLYTLATVHRDAGDHSHALELAQAALAMAREISEHRIEADSLNTLGTVYLKLGCHRQSSEHHQQALDLARQIGTRYPETEALLGLAAADLACGHHHQAAEHAQQALAIHQQTGHRLGQAHALVTLGHVLRHIDGTNEARTHWREALALLTDIGSPDAEQVRALLDAPAQ